METITTHGARCGVGALCAALELPAATYYYRSAQRRATAPQAVIAARPVPARALAPAERQQVLDVLFAVLRLTVAGGALVVVVVLGLAGARLTPRELLAQLRPVWLWLVGLLVFHLVVTDLATGALAVLRLATLVLAAAVVTATSRVAELVAVIEWLCAPLRLVGVRPGRIGLAIAMTLRFIPLIAERAERIREAQAARGATRPLFLSLVPLLVQVLQLAHTTAEALDARGADDEEPPRVVWRRT